MIRSRLALALTVLLPLFFAGCASTPTYHSGETETGLATWYGTDLDGTRTANGERFNMHDLTAAHRHLPFNSIVRVTNQKNGQSVEVRINDRGPYDDDDRIIDVSDAAAEILGMKDAGVVPCEIEVLKVGPVRHRKSDDD